MRRIGTTVAVAALASLGLAGAAQAKGTLFVAGGTSLDAEAIGADGGLTPIPPAAALGAIGTTQGVAVTPDAKHVYVAGSGFVAAANIGPTGALTPVAGSPFPIGGGAGNTRGLAITPDGRFLYAASRIGGLISTFGINADGSLFGPVNLSVGGGPDGLAVSPNGQFLFATDLPGIATFSISATGTLTQIGVPVAGGDNGIALTPDGTKLFAADVAAITAFKVGADGSLTPNGSVPPGAANPLTLAVTPDGRFVYVADLTNAPNVSAFAVGGDGTLTPVAGQPFSAANSAAGVDAAPNGFLYTSATSNTANAFSIAADGTLGVVTGSPFTLQVTNAALQSVAVTPNQGPTAAITATPAQAGQATAFNGAGSTDGDTGSVARFDWDFGDGQTLANGGSTPTHVYSQPGTYTATLTVTDDEGCSTSLVFTGQTVDCNGSSAATTQTQVTVPPTPNLRLSGPKTQKLDAAVEVGARCADPCTVDVMGKLIVRTRAAGRNALAVRRFNLRLASAQLDGKKKKTLALKVPRKARRAGLSALRRGGRVSAKLTITATGTGGGFVTEKRAVRLVRR